MAKNMVSNKAEIIREVTMEVLEKVVSSGQTYTPAEVANEVLEQVYCRFRLYNLTREKGAKWRIPDTLLPQQLA